MEGRKTFAALMVLVGAGNAVAQTGGWLLVRNAIDKGITAHDERHLTVIVLIYLGVAAAGWFLQAKPIRGLAPIGQAGGVGPPPDPFYPPTRPSPRYSSHAKASSSHPRAT